MNSFHHRGHGVFYTEDTELNVNCNAFNLCALYGSILKISVTYVVKIIITNSTYTL
jgi:hypothetical protein